MKNALVILAGGKGKRFGQKIPKQFYGKDKNILNFFLSNLEYSHFSVIVICIHKGFIDKFIDKNIIKKNKNKIIFSTPGKTRQASSFNALKKIKKLNINKVLIHDAARPLCSNILIKKVLKSLDYNNNAIPFVEYSDRQINKIKKQDEKVINIQTPQGFNFKLIYKAHLQFKNYDFPDDSTLIEKLGLKRNIIRGEKTNVKITFIDDLEFLRKLIKPILKSGIGYDIHQFDKNSKNGLKLCGIKFPYPKLIGHSDADVGLHAICDSIFGALSMRDIGYYFPNTDKKLKNVNSSKFITFCKKKLKEEGFSIVNLDVNIIAEKPNISKYVPSMKNKIAELLNIKSKCISIKATTNEKIGFIGQGEGIAAEAIVQITNEIYY